MAAFVAALLAQASDRTPWLTAILSDRFARPGMVIAGTVIALMIGNSIAAIGGAIIGPRIAAQCPDAAARARAAFRRRIGAVPDQAARPPFRLADRGVPDQPARRRHPGPGRSHPVHYRRAGGAHPGPRPRRGRRDDRGARRQRARDHRRGGGAPGAAAGGDSNRDRPPVPDRRRGAGAFGTPADLVTPISLDRQKSSRRRGSDWAILIVVATIPIHEGS